MENGNEVFETATASDTPIPAQPAKRRGRPRKNAVAEAETPAVQENKNLKSPVPAADRQPTAKPRGRKPRIQPAEPQELLVNADPTAVYAPGIVPAPANEIPGELPIDAPAPEQPETLESGDNKTNNNNNQRFFILFRNYIYQ